jgi:hypothetical protein
MLISSREFATLPAEFLSTERFRGLHGYGLPIDEGRLDVYNWESYPRQPKNGGY